MESTMRDALTKDLQAAVSGATLMWAISSVAVLALGASGLQVTYESALPVVILLSWLGAEVGSRVPARSAVAICENPECKNNGTPMTLPSGWLRWLWPWRHCTRCGQALLYECPRGHLLSSFEAESFGDEFRCARCGTSVPASALSIPEFKSRRAQLLSGIPDDADAEFYWSNVNYWIQCTPSEMTAPDRFWRLTADKLESALEAGSVPNSIKGMLITSIERLCSSNSEAKRLTWHREFQDILVKNVPSTMFSLDYALINAEKLIASVEEPPEAVSTILEDIRRESRLVQNELAEELFGISDT